MPGTSAVSDYSLPGLSVHGILQARILEYKNGLPCPPPGDLPDLGIEPESLMSPALAGRFFTARATWEALTIYIYMCTKVFLLHLIKAWKRTSRKRRRRDGEIRKHKLNEIGASACLQFPWLSPLLSVLCRETT